MLINGAVGAGAPPGEAPRSPVGRLLVVGLGLLSAVLALLVPFLPVTQTTSEIRWPTAASGTAPVDAPLVALRPESLQAQVGCAGIRGLDARTPGPATVLSTVPPGAPNGGVVGMRVSVDDGTLAIDVRGRRVAGARLPAGDCSLRITSDGDRTTGALGDGTLFTLDGDQRPQVVGIYSDLDAARDPVAATSVTVTVDNRYDSSATALKTGAGVLAVVALAGCLWLLRRLDDRDGRRVPRDRRLSRALRGQDTPRDALVAAVLVVWAVIGSMTSDDGYILTISRAEATSGFVGNYYRWFDVPEAPFGWFYQLYSVWSEIFDSVLWLRLPALGMGIASWLLISRALLPRLGTRVRRSRSAGWAAAGAFLCFWMPFDNGLRPESVVVIAALLSLVALERAIATRRLLPVAGALIAAAFAVAATPTGLIALAPFIAATRPLLRLLSERCRRTGVAASLVPLAAAGLIVLLAVFGDQTWATVAEATRVRTEIGPDLAWYEEILRYQQLFEQSMNGSLMRRFPVLLLALCTAVSGSVLLRRGRIDGAAAGFSRRLIGSTALSFAVLALTPTKWTHHFGAFAALGAGTAALAALATSTGVLRSRRNQALFLVAVLSVTALAFTGPNAWWYASNWGVPWFDKPPSVDGVSATTLLLVLAGLALLVAVREHLHGPPIPRPRRAANASAVDGSAVDGFAVDGSAAAVRGRRLSRAQAVRLGSAPIAVVCALMVLFQIASVAKGMQKQGDSYSLGTDVVTDPTGSRCGLAGRLLVETDPAAGVLPETPASSPDDTGRADGFTPDGLPPGGPGARTDTDGQGNLIAGILGAGPQGGPVVGSWSSAPDAVGTYRSSWYRLPDAARDGTAPLVLGIAGTVDDDNTVTLQFSRGTGPAARIVDEISPPGAAGTVTTTADPSGLAAGGRGWRDVRLDLAGTPAATADRVRVMAVDRGTGPNSWIAVAQPRVPVLTPLTTLVGDRPVYLDWPAAFTSPCLRQFDITAGIAEVPAFRLLADAPMRPVGDNWSFPSTGGPQGWLNQVAAARLLPLYLPGDWDFDPGQLRSVEPYVPTARPDIVTGTHTRWGWSSETPTGDPPSDPPPVPS